MHIKQRNRFENAWVFGVLVICISLIYLPFLDNQLIFDDHFFYQPGMLSHYATTPISWHPRAFPYFTFGFIHALTQSFEVQRFMNALLHLAVSCLLYVLLEKCSKGNESVSRQQNTSLAGAVVALLFAANAVAVYATGYLVQRTILFATLFSLASLIVLVDAIQLANAKKIAVAVALSTAAMFSKEHAVLLPFAAVFVVLASTAEKPRKQQLRLLASFVIANLPAMVWLAIGQRYALANPYEIHAPIYLAEAGEHLWLRSALNESSLFFRYLALWLVPIAEKMAIDLRVDFPTEIMSVGNILGATAFISVGAISLFALLTPNRYRLMWAGLLYAQTLFVVELATIRIQEPFVLYRSYLWAPGFALIAFSLLNAIPRQWLLALSLIVVPVFALNSHERLHSLSSSMSAWADAQEKLPSDKVNGAFRIYFNLGINHLRANEPDRAISYFERCMISGAAFSGCRQGMAKAYLHKKDYLSALEQADMAIAIDPKHPGNWQLRGSALKKLGKVEDAEIAFQKAEELGGTLGGFIRKNIR